MSERPAELTPQQERGGDPARVVAFSDGVLAIVITILVLDLRVPELGEGQRLADALGESRSTFVAWVVSFLLTGMYWAWHREVFTHVRYVDRITVWLNLLFLLTTALLPFAASVLGSYPDSPTALYLYGSVLIAITLSRVLLDSYLFAQQGLLWDPVTPRAQRYALLLAGGPLVVYLLAIALAATAPGVSVVLFFVVPGLYLASVALLRRDHRTQVDADSVT